MAFNKNKFICLVPKESLYVLNRFLHKKRKNVNIAMNIDA